MIFSFVERGFAFGRKSLLLLNIFPWIYYDPLYEQRQRPRDITVQLLLTLVAIATAAALVVEALIVLAATADVQIEVVSSPTAARLVALFAEQLNGDVQGLTCPCNVQSAPLSSLAQLSAPEDSFCDSVRNITDTTFAVDPFLVNVLLNPANELSNPNLYCIPAASRPQFIVDATAYATAAGLFPPGERQASDFATFAIELEQAVCGLAFGMLPFSPSFFPRPVPHEATEFNNSCSVVGGNNETFRFVPLNFFYSNSFETIVQLQHTRLRSLFAASTAVCSELFNQRNAFLEEVNDLPLNTPIALPESELGTATARLYSDLLSTRGASAVSFVPGSLPDDAIARATLTLDPLAFMQVVIQAPNFFPPNAYPLSSRLPFVRADFVAGGAMYFYILGRFASTADGLSEPVPQLSGDARVIVTGSPDDFPPSDVANQRPALHYRVRPPECQFHLGAYRGRPPLLAGRVPRRVGDLSGCAQLAPPRVAPTIQHSRELRGTVGHCKCRPLRQSFSVFCRHGRLSLC